MEFQKASTVGSPPVAAGLDKLTEAMIGIADRQSRIVDSPKAAE
jgi:hypothetical protein